MSIRTLSEITKNTIKNRIVLDRMTNRRLDIDFLKRYIINGVSDSEGGYLLQKTFFRGRPLLPEGAAFDEQNRNIQEKLRFPGTQRGVLWQIQMD